MLLKNVNITLIGTPHSFSRVTVFHHESISPTFYAQLISAQILKAQKRQSGQAAFCTFGICVLKS